MQITAITQQTRDKNRVNVSVDGLYKFSLEIAQLVELGVKVGAEYSQDELERLVDESAYGKLYARALEYVLMRPHSAYEVRQYLWRKTREKRLPDGRTQPGVSATLTDRVFDRLQEKGYIDDEVFARQWVENRRLRTGISRRKFEQELRQKGVEGQVIARALGDTQRTDIDELRKVIAKRASRYDDPQKLRAYLQRQGFSYSDIVEALGDGD